MIRSHMNRGKKLASDIKFYMDYSKYREDLGRTESWEDSVDRVMNMHRQKYEKHFSNPVFAEMFEFATKSYKEKNILGSQRALQFGGAPILKHNAKMYNCTGSYIDRVKFFQEALYLLLCGCGVGFSVQKHHIAKLPDIAPRTKGPKTFVIQDSIEGWADAFGAFVSSYFKGEVPFPEYQQHVVHYDFSLIRPKGALISGGFKAPGPEGLRKSLQKAEELMEKTLREGNSRMKSIIAYDLMMHMSDAVLSGGVRRSATICTFSHDDEEMMSAKIGNWFYENPQRARSNNSVVLMRDQTSKEDFDKIFENIKQYGEPGFLFVDDLEMQVNPCVEIGFYCYNEKGESGWQGCNLTEGNGDRCTTPEKFYEICRALSIMGTLQAGYDSFPYLGKVSEDIFKREALLGCSFTGWMDNPDIMLDPEVQRRGAQIIIETNEILAPIIGINCCARGTCSKPAGNASVLLGCSSSTGGEHAERFFRLMQINKENEIAKMLSRDYPDIIENSFWSREQTDYVVYVPIEPRSNAIFKEALVGIKQLEAVKTIQQNWVEAGTVLERCVNKKIRHNVSNTVEVDDWQSIQDYLYENRQWFAGVSFVPRSVDKDFVQAPFTSVLTPNQILEKYGDGAIFASGLIVDGLHCFNSDLWKACDHIVRRDLQLEGTRTQVLLQKDWIVRAKSFAKKFFKGNLQKTCYCLKDVHLFHKWTKVTRALKNEIDFSTLDLRPEYTDVDTLGAVACAGGACELPSHMLQVPSQTAAA